MDLQTDDDQFLSNKEEKIRIGPVQQRNEDAMEGPNSDVREKRVRKGRGESRGASRDYCCSEE